MQCVWIHYVALDVLTIVVCEIPVNGSLNCLLEEKSHNDHTQGMEREVESKSSVREVGHRTSPGITSLLRRLTGKTKPKMIPERQRKNGTGSLPRTCHCLM